MANQSVQPRDAVATRARLVDAARATFARRGFDASTVREIAAEAGVNAALINRYYGGKERLFAEALAADLSLPDLSHTPRDQVGEALIRHFFQRWEGGEGALLQMLIRSAATNPDAAARMRAVLRDQIEPAVVALTGTEGARQRAVLIATQVLGLAFCRNVLGLGDADLSQSEAVSRVGATIQIYLFGTR